MLDCGCEKLQWLAALNPWVTEGSTSDGRIRSNTVNIQPVRQSSGKMDSPTDSNGGRVQKMTVLPGSILIVTDCQHAHAPLLKFKLNL